MKTRVYSKSGYVQCVAVKRYLDKNDMEYIEYKIDEDEKARQQALATGYKQAPIIISDVGTFSGNNVPMLDALKHRQKGGH